MFAGIPFRPREGSRYLIFRCPEDNTMCYNLKILDGGGAACVTCIHLAETAPAESPKEVIKFETQRNDRLVDDPTKSFYHLAGCHPMKFTDVKDIDKQSFLSRSATEQSPQYNIDRNRGKLEACADNVVTDLDHRSGTIANIDNGSGSSSDNSRYSSLVVQKKLPSVHLYRLPKKNNRCYLFQEVRNTPYLKCMTCLAVNEKTKKCGVIQKVASRNFSGGYMLEDPLLNHLNGCKPGLFSEIMEKYNRVQDFLNVLPSRGKFVLERVQLPVQCLVVRLPGDVSVAQCYRFYIDKHKRLNVQLKYMTCKTCVNLRDKGNIPSSVKVSMRHFTKDGFADDPTASHVPGCEPLLFSDVMKDFEIINDEPTKFFHNLNNIVTPTAPKKIPFMKSIKREKASTLRNSAIEIRNVAEAAGESNNLETGLNFEVDSVNDYSTNKGSVSPLDDDIDSALHQNHSDVNAQKEIKQEEDVIFEAQEVLPVLCKTEIPRRIVERNSDDIAQEPQMKRCKPTQIPNSTVANSCSYLQVHALTFSANGFTENEMTWHLDGRVAEVNFTRMIESPFGCEHTAIRHQIRVVFPETIDLAEVMVEMMNNKVSVSAPNI